MTEPTDEELDSVLCHHWPAFSMQAVLVQMWLRDAMRAVLAKWGTPQQEAQEPAFWTRQRFGEEREFCEAPFTTDWTPLYTAPQPAPALSDDAKDAARYRWLRENWFTMTSSYYQQRITFKVGEPRWSNITEAELDAVIDASLSAQKDTP